MSPQRGQRGKFDPAFLHVEHIALQENLERFSTASRTGWSLASLYSDGDGGEVRGRGVTGPEEGPPQSKSESDNKVRLMDGLRLERAGD